MKGIEMTDMKDGYVRQNLWHYRENLFFHEALLPVRINIHRRRIA